MRERERVCVNYQCSGKQKMRVLSQSCVCSLMRSVRIKAELKHTHTFTDLTLLKQRNPLNGPAGESYSIKLGIWLKLHLNKLNHFVSNSYCHKPHEKTWHQCNWCCIILTASSNHYKTFITKEGRMLEIVHVFLNNVR